MKSSHLKPVAVPRMPLRTCIACRKKGIKRELIRLVHTPEDSIEVDTTGKKSGRGAYLCPRQECWELALKSSHLERALRGRFTRGDREQLANYASSLPRGAN